MTTIRTRATLLVCGRARACLGGGLRTRYAEQRPDREEMYIKASALTKLSAAVESTVRYKNPPPGLNDRELLTLATRHDPALPG